ncbi:MAG: citrate/2-methylcitrate synthase, partial [Candidatus Thermoplasmatota archaeon]|nr:citrate/2-methylcitrate synthase [Candidatus Thermoplasmatota archaeon]
RLLEATITACVDHGVTPPSAQATRLAATVRGAYEVCIEHGIGVITDVHGGAGMKAAKFFASCAAMKNEKGGLEEALRFTIEEYSSKKKRIAGLGHRVHNNDPRRDVLWKLADEAGVSGDCVALSRMISGVFQEETGKSLPINVDGVIGAIVADIGLDASMAKTIFIMGRAAGLSAHCYEEMETQPQMRRIDFSKAVYNGPGERNIV